MFLINILGTYLKRCRQDKKGQKIVYFIEQLIIENIFLSSDESRFLPFSTSSSAYFF